MVSAPKVSNLSVLIVDGNAHHRSIISEILRSAGFTRIFSAQSAGDAIQEMRMWQPGVVIMEWSLTPIDGIELTKRIRRGEQGVDRMTPIVMLTARNTVADVETARLAGVHEYAIKPVSSTALLTRIEAAALRPRRFVDSPVYVGPCRRRKKDDLYQGPRRRLVDPISAESQKAKAAVSVARLRELTALFDPEDRNAVRAVYDAAQDVKTITREIGDVSLGAAADSLARYIESVGATSRLEPDVVQAHADALDQLVALPAGQANARIALVRDLEAAVVKKVRQNVA